MNSNVNNAIIMMDNDELRELVTEVKETVATNVDKQFSAADLWRIQRNMRTAHGARRRNLHS